jgi:hypothetical protein
MALAEITHDAEVVNEPTLEELAAKRHLSLAMAQLYKAEDEIKNALGIS